MRFDMLERDTVDCAEGGDSPNLVDHVILDLSEGTIHEAAPEAHEIGETGMSSHADSMGRGHLDGSVQYQGISRVEATGDVGRGHELEDIVIRSKGVDAEGLSHVTVEVNSMH